MIHTPTHEKIARRAQEIWQRRGNPSGHDTAIWLEAEHQLTVDTPEPPQSGSAEAHGGDALLKSPDAVAAKTASQEKAARSPQQMHGKNAPHPAPPESGKPLWDTPHSS